jgi:hypothetical protein
MSRTDGVLRSIHDRPKVGTAERRSEMTRYLLVVNFEGGVVETPMEEWKPEEITAHLDYYKALHRELVSSGELVGSRFWLAPTWPRS